MQDEKGFSVTHELAKAEFGDVRLSRRLEILSNILSSRPSDSFPDAAGSVAALEATYRFLGNSKVTPERILAPHVEATIVRALSSDRVLVIHDTSELLFGGKSRREELGWTKKGNQGFLAHFSLALSREHIVRPLGVLNVEPFFRRGKPIGIDPRRAKKSFRNRESQRWWNCAHSTNCLFPLGQNPIHVMDREADDYELFSDLCDQSFRFVIRVRQNRADCAIFGTGKKGKLFELLSTLDAVCEREVPISKKKGDTWQPKRRGHQPRGARIAKLRISAGTIQLPRPYYAFGHLPPSLTLNFVHIVEIEVPPGEEAVEWHLVTNESIKTLEDVLNIVDDYRARWTIEEFFKALKTGCAYEKRQLENKQSLLNALAVFTPIAWQLLSMRTLSRTQKESPATLALTKTQIDVLKAVSKKSISDCPTIEEALTGVAALGGHIPNNGPPGWQIIARGMERLVTMEIAWLAKEGCDQS